MSKVTKERLEVGQRIKAKRQEAGISQTDLSKSLGLSAGVTYMYEKGKAMPTEENMEKIAKQLNTTVLYLTTGLLETPNMTKKEVSNHEGYADPTAALAMKSVVKNKPISCDVGIVYTIDGSDYLVLRKFGKFAVVVAVTDYRYDDEKEFSPAFIVGDSKYYAIFSRLQIRKQEDLFEKKIPVGEVSMVTLQHRLDKILGTELKVEEKTVEKIVEIEKPVEKIIYKDLDKEPDDISVLFSESIKYFNEKNGSNMPIPSGVVTLKEAVETSKTMDISLSELTRDHTEDRILDEICAYEEKIKQLKAKIGMD